MKIAYLILVHKHPGQLVRLVRKLSTEKTSFFVHIDKKTDDEVYSQMVRGLGNVPKVHFLKRQRVVWGHSSIVTATIRGIREMFNQNVPFDYVVLLSGQDYPLKSNSYIEKILRDNEPNSFIEYFPLPYAHWQEQGEDNGGLDRIEYWHFRLFGRPLKFPAERRFNSRIVSLLWSTLIFFFPVKRKFPKGFKPFAGSAWWCLSRDCVEYVYDFTERNRAFVNFFKYVAAPDEIFFQTVVLNSPFKESVINDSLRYIHWPDNWDHPAVLREDDFEDIAKSSSLFARKFDISVDAGVLDMIDQKLLNEVGSGQ